MSLTHLLAAAIATASVLSSVQATGDAEAGMITSSPGQFHYYAPSQVRYVASGGEFRTIVRGNAFAMSKADFDTLVTGLMDGRPGWAPPGRYTTMPSANAKTAYWVVLAFNPPAVYDGVRACEGRDAAGLPDPSGAVEVVAAFCSKVHVLSQTRARLDHARGPDDPGFADLIHRAQLDIFPYRLPDPGGRAWPVE